MLTILCFVRILSKMERLVAASFTSFTSERYDFCILDGILFVFYLKFCYE